MKELDECEHRASRHCAGRSTTLRRKNACSLIARSNRWHGGLWTHCSSGHCSMRIRLQVWAAHEHRETKEPTNGLFPIVCSNTLYPLQVACELWFTRDTYVVLRLSA